MRNYLIRESRYFSKECLSLNVLSLVNYKYSHYHTRFLESNLLVQLKEWEHFKNIKANRDKKRNDKLGTGAEIIVGIQNKAWIFCDKLPQYFTWRLLRPLWTSHKRGTSINVIGHSTSRLRRWKKIWNPLYFAWIDEDISKSTDSFKSFFRNRISIIPK